MFLFVSAELISQRGEQLVGEVLIAARGEALRQRGAQDRRRYALVDGCLEGPASLTRIRDVAREPAEVGALLQGGGREVEEPGADDAAVPPGFDDIGKVQVVLVEFGMSERGGLGIDCALAFPALAWRRMLSPSAYAAMIPYSIPL